MKQEFQEKGKYMKVKEFLENFTGDNHIKIYDMHSFDTHRYNNANEDNLVIIQSENGKLLIMS